MFSKETILKMIEKVRTSEKKLSVKVLEKASQELESCINKNLSKLDENKKVETIITFHMWENDIAGVLFRDNELTNKVKSLFEKDLETLTSDAVSLTLKRFVTDCDEDGESLSVEIDVVLEV